MVKFDFDRATGFGKEGRDRAIAQQRARRAERRAELTLLVAIAVLGGTMLAGHYMVLPLWAVFTVLGGGSAAVLTSMGLLLYGFVVGRGKL